MTDKIAEGRRLQAVSFVETITLVDERSSVAVASHGVLSIQPAVMLPDGSWQACDKGQRSDGVAVRRKRGTSGHEVIVSAFVPWANVRSVSFGE